MPRTTLHKYANPNAPPPSFQLTSLSFCIQKAAAAAFLQGKNSIFDAAGYGEVDVIAARAANGEDMNQEHQQDRCV